MKHIIGVSTDSHANVGPEEAKARGIRVVPMPFTINGKNYLEGVNLSREEFFMFLNGGADVQSSQPAPGDVAALWDDMLRTCDEIVHIPISSGLSGSCATAKALAAEPPYRDRVFVVDNGRVSTPMHRSVLDALDLIEAGHSARETRDILDRCKEDMIIYVAVDSLRFLRKGGRISSTVAMVGTLLNVKPILYVTTGQLEPYRNCRGFHKARRAMIEAVKNDLATRFRDADQRGTLRLLAASSASPGGTADWVREIQEAIPGLPVMCDELTMGVACHLGENTLGVGVSVSPRG